MNEILRDRRRRAGRLGGIQTLLRHGKEHYREMGRQGGRPRALIYTDIARRLPAEDITNEKRRINQSNIELVATKNLTVLRKLWRQKIQQMEVARAIKESDSETTGEAQPI